MVIWLHLVTALLALGLGTANLVLAKGTRRHRMVGAVWIAAMLCVTVSSFWIRELNHGALSWIHGLTVWTLFSMCVAVFATRTGRVRLHAGFMVGTMIGAFVAGAFALDPGRFIGRSRTERGAGEGFASVRVPFRGGHRDGRGGPANFDPYSAAARVVAEHVEHGSAFSCTVSDRALMSLEPILRSGAQLGTSPHRSFAMACSEFSSRNTAKSCVGHAL